MSEILGPFGQRVQRRRHELGVQQHELADQIGLSRTSVASIETGRQNLGIERLTLLAKALETTVAALLGEHEPSRLPDVQITQSWTVRCDKCGVLSSEPTHEAARAVRTDHVREEHAS